MSDDTTTVSGEAMGGADPQPVLTAQPAPLVPEVGGSALYYPSASADDADPLPEVCDIQHVWTDTCVNLDNGKTSVLVVAGDGQERPSGHYCVLLSPLEAEEIGRELDSKRAQSGTGAIGDPSADVLAQSLGVDRLDHARALPEVPADEPAVPVANGIQQFKASETDRRTLRVVVARGGLACQEVGA